MSAIEILLKVYKIASVGKILSGQFINRTKTKTGKLVENTTARK